MDLNEDLNVKLYDWWNHQIFLFVCCFLYNILKNFWRFNPLRANVAALKPRHFPSVQQTIFSIFYCVTECFHFPASFLMFFIQKCVSLKFFCCKIYASFLRQPYKIWLIWQICWKANIHGVMSMSVVTDLVRVFLHKDKQKTFS